MVKRKSNSSKRKHAKSPLVNGASAGGITKKSNSRNHPALATSSSDASTKSHTPSVTVQRDRRKAAAIRSPNLLQSHAQRSLVFAFRMRPVFQGHVIMEPTCLRDTSSPDTAEGNSDPQVQPESPATSAPTSVIIGGGKITSATSSVAGTPKKAKRMGVHTEVLRAARKTSARGAGLVRLLITHIPN
ncbi:uncharacterized protein VTP21DRAFT_113 [Calcarisporiella thermophila]|uniref:uncharacterized protein n=1 Tax=Calcarisporiella thermophila TaxID=911321 RepID=UPI0037425007